MLQPTDTAGTPPVIRREAYAAPAYLVDTCDEIDPTWLNVKTLGISAGASAPEYILQECLELLKTKYGFSY